MSQKILKLLVIGHKEWCDEISNIFSDSEKYHIQVIFQYQTALNRLKHNSYDTLIIQESYFKFNSIELGQLSYAMSRPSVIVCQTMLKTLIYNIWKIFGNFCGRYSIAKRLIHIKYQNSFKNFEKYILSIPDQHNTILQISKEIKR